MSTSPKKLVRMVEMLVAVVALSTVMLAVLPATAEAQEPTVHVVNPDDSLWSIAQNRLGPDASPERINYEVGRIFEFNRERIGDDPNLILPGQALLLAEETELATDPSATEFPTTATTISDEPATPEPQDESAPQTATSSESADEHAASKSSSTGNNFGEASYPKQEYTNRQAPSVLTLLLSLGVFLLALVVAIFGSLRLLTRWRSLTKRYEPSIHHDRPGYYGDYAGLHHLEGEKDEPAADSQAPERAPERDREPPTRESSRVVESKESRL